MRKDDAVPTAPRFIEPGTPLALRLGDPGCGYRQDVSDVSDLRAFLVPAQFAASIDVEPSPLVWGISDDLHLLIGFAGPDNKAQIVSRLEVLELGTEDEVSGLAIDHTANELGVRRGRIQFTDEGPVVWTLEGGSLSVATHGLWANEIDPPASDHGTLVAVPTSHCVYAHTIRDASVRSAIDYMLQIAFDLGREGQWALSPHLYWQRHGSFERLPVFLEDGRIGMQATQDFSDLLDLLCG
jgi:hypothetical protein